MEKQVVSAPGQTLRPAEPRHREAGTATCAGAHVTGAAARVAGAAARAGALAADVCPNNAPPSCHTTGHAP